jgi:hypothetical protein
MLRRFFLIALGFALIVPLTAGGCKDSKSGVPRIKDKAPEDGPKPIELGQPGGGAPAGAPAGKGGSAGASAQ